MELLRSILRLRDSVEVESTLWLKNVSLQLSAASMNAKELLPVPYTMTSLNVVLQDVPAGNDYFLLCRNSTAGITYSVSSRFSVADANATGSNPSPASAPTVTVSGTPNALSQFAQTFGPSATNGAAQPGWAGIGNQVTAISVAVGAILVGGVITLY